VLAAAAFAGFGQPGWSRASIAHLGILAGEIAREGREMSFLGRYGVLAALVVVALLVVGCGETVIDDVKTEDAIEKNLRASFGERLSKVECPSGVEVKTGTTFDCAVKRSDGTEETVKLKILNEDADVEMVKLVPRD
jgi:uncharacterized protein DUF4333